MVSTVVGHRTHGKKALTGAHRIRTTPRAADADDFNGEKRVIEFTLSRFGLIDTKDWEYRHWHSDGIKFSSLTSFGSALCRRVIRQSTYGGVMITRVLVDGVGEM